MFYTMVCCDIQSYMHCNRQYPVRKIYKQESFTLYGNVKTCCILYVIQTKKIEMKTAEVSIEIMFH